MAMHNRSSRFQPRLQLRPVALALVCLGLAPALAQTLPTGLLPIAGGVTAATPNAATMNITQTTARAIAQWNTFSIGADATLNIAQPSTSSVLLNRLVGGAPASVIAGKMNANGHVYLINPAGVTFSKGSSVSVGGLIASTLSMSTSDEAFMGGATRLEFARPSGAFGSVENEGSIVVGNGGTAALIGSLVANRGSIVANGGTAAMASGETVTIDFAGDGLTTLRVTPGLYSGVANSGTMQANGGRVALIATTGFEVSNGVVNSRGVLRADSMASRNGEIILDSGLAPEGVRMTGGLVSAAGNGAGLTGGTIDITGRVIGLEPFVPPLSSVPPPPPPGSDDRGVLDASGSAGGGRIRLYANAVTEIGDTGAIAFGAGSIMRADATVSGNGGDVRLLAERSLRAFGSISARGGASGGNGGFIETSGGFAAPDDGLGGGFSLNGLRVDAAAPAGTAGTWLVDPFNVDIVPGAAAGTLPANPFEPIAASTIQDSDINDALNGGTSVRITTGAPGAGSPTDGDIRMFNGVRINYSAANGPLTFQLDAHRSVRGDANVVIESSGAGGPLNVVFNTDVNGGGAATGGGQVSYSGDIYTNGGNVVMNGAWSAAGAGPSVSLDGNVIDTRVGRTDAGAGGSVTIFGNTSGPSGGGFTEAAVSIDGVQIATSTGNVDITGIGANTSGVRLGSRFTVTGSPNRQTDISTTSGNITVRGVGNFTGNSNEIPGHGVVLNDAVLRSVDGNIAVRGLRQADTGEAGDGVLLRNGSRIVTTGTGSIELTGQTGGNGAGVRLGPAAPVPGVFPVVLAGVSVSSAGGNVVLRASNDGSTDALVIDGTVSAGNVVNLRPGGVAADGTAFDQVAIPITLGGTANTGFAVSADEFSRISAGNAIVAGSNAHAADIAVVGPLALASGLTLQNGGGGNINLGGAISTPRLGLLSAGNITQTAAAPITAGTLLARSTGGNVLLDQAANNVSANTLGGGAAGAFRYQDVDELRIGPVSVVGYDAAGNAPQVVSAGSMAADTVFVRTLSGDLQLGTAVSSTSGTDLVAAGRFQNVGGASLSGAPWRVWADTWVGETRGGVAGSGLLPNLYNCAYLGLCGVSASPGDNHFIYAQRPTATVVIGNAARPAGFDNPFFTWSITGLILGDRGAGFSGAVGSAANRSSPPGAYAINGSFTSAEGYLVNVVPGTLTVGGFPQIPKADVIRELPTTWLYDRNMGPPPICFATGPLEGDRASQGNDVLAREWSRVRSRPNLTSCVDSEKRNGCADF
ncbi:filamentous hemagglutinin family protein [Variovorax paradoxus]|uniref:beta strand repeat-containing protein n=1 Tax=Variovorax paradoxus TaxID=34073 RepID=UPI00278DC0CA|nr:filamentous hemagglutinin N-terminal domain-containing protein [Variovorax paradoxus]MDQ0572699.1 filamentous hemagglutinin family protein [Variovorax paradoxus]